VIGAAGQPVMHDFKPAERLSLVAGKFVDPLLGRRLMLADDVRLITDLSPGIPITVEN
jgi:hypothetical protein